MAAFCLSSVKCVVTSASTPPGFRASMDLAKKIVVQRELLPVVVELEVGERHVADHGVDAILRQLGVAEILDADVLAGMECLGDAAGDGIEFDADEAHARLALAHEIAGAASGFQDRGTLGHAQAGRWPRGWP